MRRAASLLLCGHGLFVAGPPRAVMGDLVLFSRHPSSLVSTLPRRPNHPYLQSGPRGKGGSSLCEGALALRVFDGAALGSSQRGTLSRVLPLRLMSGISKSPPPGQPTKEVAKQETGMQKARRLYGAIRSILSDYKAGLKLFVLEMKVSFRLARRYASGRHLSRRESILLRRATKDVGRLLPFMASIMTVGFTLTNTVVLRVFPMLLPSTFKKPESKNAQEKEQEDLSVKRDIGKSLNEEVERIVEVEVENTQDDSILKAELHDFIDKVRDPDAYVSHKQVAAVSSIFSDRLSLESIPRDVLLRLCYMVDIARNPYLSAVLPNFVLRILIRKSLHNLTADDKNIVWEGGVEKLSDVEIEMACEARGIYVKVAKNDNAGTFVPIHVLRRQLNRWIELSRNRNIPSSLLLISNVLDHSSIDQMTLRKKVDVPGELGDDLEPENDQDGMHEGGGTPPCEFFKEDTERKESKKLRHLQELLRELREKTGDEATGSRKAA